MVITSIGKAEMPMGVVLQFIFSHIPVKLREDLKSNSVEVIWLHLKPILVGSCYRPPNANSLVGSCYRPANANSQYLDVYEMLDNVCDINRKLYFPAFIKMPTHEKASNCNQCLQPGSEYQSTYQGVYKQHNETIHMY
jgi:hypothetical protein